MRRLPAFCYDSYRCKAALFTIAFVIGISSRSQTIQYSKQNLKAPYFDAIQLVPGISGNHHILFLAKNENIVLHVYDNALQFLSKIEMPFKVIEHADISTVPFDNFYFLYIHQQGSSKHELWKIEANGNATSVSDLFMNIIGDVFKINTSTLQLINKKNELVIIANTYFDEIGKIAGTVTQADENLNIIRTRRVFYNFAEFGEGLRQVTLAGDDLFILKTVRDTTSHLLSIIRANLNTGLSVVNSFNSGSNSFSNPMLNYHDADSSITVYSRIRRTFFITRLDYSLNEIAPVTLFNNKAPYNFLLLPGPQQRWLGIHEQNNLFPELGSPTFTNSAINSASEVRSGFDSYGNIIFDNSSFSTRRIVSSKEGSYSYAGDYRRYSNEHAIGFRVLNNKFAVLKDSVVANNKNSYSIYPNRYRSVVLQNKSYLFLKQQFGSNRFGLLLINGNAEGELTATDIRVYDKYEYLLPQMQAVNNKYVLVPYTYKKELGLVKITLN